MIQPTICELRKNADKHFSIANPEGQARQGPTFHVAHIIPQSKGGHWVLENLALACPGGNLHKADRTTSVDPATGEQAPLFHPIRQRWSEHFRFKGYEMEGSTPVGRATVAMLNLNHVRRRRFAKLKKSSGCILELAEDILSCKAKDFGAIYEQSVPKVAQQSALGIGHNTDCRFSERRDALLRSFFKTFPTHLTVR